MSYFVGIDLGTTYTAAAIYRNNRAAIFSLGGRSASIPSVVLLREDETVLTGDAAVRRAITEPERVAREFKRRLGDTTPIIVGGSPYSAEALMARLLKSVLEEVEKREGEPPEGIAISHPANWGLYKIDLLKQAVRLAGLNDDTVTLLTEPEAAVISYASQERVEAGEVVAVYDLGGGTFDAAVLRRTEEGFEIIGKPEGIERLGGIDFDAAVFAHVARSLDGALGKLDPDDSAAQAAMARLRQDCVDAKEALSADTDATIPVLLPNLQTDVRITRREYESLIRPSLVDSIEAMRRALVSAGVTAEEVSRVLLVGGSSRTPLIAQLVSSELGRPVAVDAHPKHAVALGAAHAAAGTVGAELDTTAAAVPVVPPTPDASATPPTSIAATPAVPPTPAQKSTPATPPTPPTPSAKKPASPTTPASPPTPSSIFEEPTPGVPSSSAGVPVVPSDVGQAPKRPAPKKPEPVSPVANKPEAKIPPTPAAERRTETLPTSGPPPRLVETPKQADPLVSTPHGAVKGSDAPGAPVDVSSKSRGPLIAALVGVVAVIGIGGFALSKLGGDDGVGATGTSEVAQSTTTEPGDDPTTTAPVEDTTTPTDAPIVSVPDDDLTEDVFLALKDSIGLLEVSVAQGTVSLGGYADSTEDRDAARDMVGEIPGVEPPVINNILVHTEDELCTDLIQSQPRWACITDAWIDVDGSVNAIFESQDDGTNFSIGSSFHLHVFGSQIDPINAGADGDASKGGGPWQVWDITPGFTDAPVAVFGSTEIPDKLCVRIATPRHTLESLDSGNCFPIRFEEG